MNIKNITTYGDLKKALPSTGSVKVPGINQLKKKATVLLRRETGSGIIEIYDNGFFTFEECGSRPTVFGVDRCSWKDTYSDVQTSRHEITTELDSYPWDMILESAGAARLSHNADSRNDYHSEISLDAPESENKIAFSVKPEHEIREQEEAEAGRKAAMLIAMKEGLKSLKPRQREILILRYGKGLSYEEIGKQMGITKGTAHTNCERALKKARKNILK